MNLSSYGQMKIPLHGPRESQLKSRSAAVDPNSGQALALVPVQSRPPPDPARLHGARVKQRPPVAPGRRQAWRPIRSKLTTYALSALPVGGVVATLERVEPNE